LYIRKPYSLDKPCVENEKKRVKAQDEEWEGTAMKKEKKKEKLKAGKTKKKLNLKKNRLNEWKKAEGKQVEDWL
jgi:hypothetical protein